MVSALYVRIVFVDLELIRLYFLTLRQGPQIHKHSGNNR